MGSLHRCVLMVVLSQQVLLVLGFAAAPAVRISSISGQSSRVAAARANGELLPGCFSCRGQRMVRPPVTIVMSGPTPVELGPDLGQRPAGPDPFSKVHGDMQLIKAKIKNIADRAMSTSSNSLHPRNQLLFLTMHRVFVPKSASKLDIDLRFSLQARA